MLYAYSNLLNAHSKYSRSKKSINFLFPPASSKERWILLADSQFGSFFSCSSNIMRILNVWGAALCTLKIKWDLLYLYHESRLKTDIQELVLNILFTGAFMMNIEQLPLQLNVQEQLLSITCKNNSNSTIKTHNNIHSTSSYTLVDELVWPAGSGQLCLEHNLSEINNSGRFVSSNTVGHFEASC